MFKIIFSLPIIMVAATVIISCDQNRKVLVTKENYVTSEAGDKIAQKENIDVFYFSSFDETWKIEKEGDVGAYWGLWDKDGNLKYGNS